MTDMSNVGALIIIALLFALCLGGVLLFRWHKEKKRQVLQAAKIAEKAERRQKKRQEQQKIRQTQVSAVKDARANGDRRPVVLVVDDSTVALELTRRILEENRYRVVTANHGRDAWAALQDLHPDLILTDIEMPHLDGFGLLKLVRADLALADVPVILMTANPVDHIKKGQQQGIDGFLPKPYEETDLIEQIRYVLQE